MMVESTLPSFKELLDGSRLSTDDVDIIQDDCQLPSQTDTTPIVTSTNLYIAPMTRHSPQGHLTESTFEHISGRKALKITASGNSNTPRRDSCHWQGQGCSHVLFPSKDQLEHDVCPIRIRPQATEHYQQGRLINVAGLWALSKKFFHVEKPVNAFLAMMYSLWAIRVLR